MGARPQMDALRKVIRELVSESGVGARKFEAMHGLRPWALRGILDPKRKQSPSVDRAAEVCKALGLEFYVGPPRDESTSPEVADATPDVAPDWAMEMQEGLQKGLQGSLQAELAALKAELTPVLRLISSTDLSDETATAVEGSPSRPVVTYELAAAAGGGAMELDETPTGIVYFRYDWLTQHGLDAKQCCVMGVVGESMETMLPDGCAILVNRRPGIRRRVDHLYVVINDLGLIVKRAGKDENGQWLLVSDHPAWKPVPWGDAQMIGEVKWMARTFA